MNFRQSRYGTARVGNTWMLIQADRWLQSFDGIDSRPFALMEKLPRVDRQRFNVLALPLDKQCVQGQGALARSAGSCDDDQLIPWNIQVQVLEIVGARTANADVVATLIRRSPHHHSYSRN